ncbi:DUF669 domain-containing protein [Rhizobium leucaenae]|uniref:DUF669 domain-containing protein n=1 Tax=Rhizobium leucaenae TaxID=29450 RepID=UPI00041027CF|nr:DUF669 domain-containing protein [Rhizobium leucaenae]
MAALGKSFDATQHDTTQREFAGELPNGIFRLEIETSEVKPTSKGTGTYLSTIVKVVEPEEYKGRTIFNNNYNLENANPVAQEIGQKQFASLCRAIGISEVEDSEELHFRAFVAKVGRGKPSVGKDGKEYPGRAEIKRYFFPDEELPELGIDAIQPDDEKPAAANDNRAPAANDNRQAARPAAAAAAPTGRRPWGSK